MAKTIYLRDMDSDLVDAWRAEFALYPEVEVSCGDIFEIKADVLVSPANSFGFMDGGIDLVYSRRLGWHVQDRLRAYLAEHWMGECPVGCAVIIETDDADYPYLVSAPTMRAPDVVSHTINAYLAFRATLRVVQDLEQTHPGSVETILCPGLGTATGGMAPRDCARQMRVAYEEVMLGKGGQIESVNEAINHKYRMLRVKAG